MTGQDASDPKPFVGVVTVLYKSDDVLADFFASIALQFDASLRLRLYVIDNSPYRSGTALAEELALLHCIDAVCIFNKNNVGVAAGNNQGIRLALGDGCSHVLLANNDTVFDAGIIRGLIRTLLSEKATAVTPKIYFFEPAVPKLLWYAGAPFSSWTTRGPHRGLGEPDRGQYDRLEDTEYAPTCFMLVDVRVFSDIGLMDERYFCYYDDTDFVFRLRRNGGRLVYDPSQKIDHKVSSSTGGDLSPFSLYYMNRNRIYFARKNLYGVKKIFALFYMTLTRFPRTMMLPKTAAERVWAGVHDGWRLKL